MRNFIIGVGVVITALVLGIGSAWAASRWMFKERGFTGQGSWSVPWGHSGMMGGYSAYNQPGTGKRIEIDEAKKQAEEYITRYGTSLQMAEIMEFQNNFYAVALEKDTNRGAFEILVDPFSGAIYPEPGANMMWNRKYGHMAFGGGFTGENSLSLEEAQAYAQQFLDGTLPGAQVEEHGFAFYGYYTFDFEQDGKIAGMLSVHATTGQVWPHTWHGQFITEMEMDE